MYLYAIVYKTYSSHIVQDEKQKDGVTQRIKSSDWKLSQVSKNKSKSNFTAKICKCQ